MLAKVKLQMVSVLNDMVFMHQLIPFDRLLAALVLHPTDDRATEISLLIIHSMVRFYTEILFLISTCKVEVSDVTSVCFTVVKMFVFWSLQSLKSLKSRLYDIIRDADILLL